MNLPKQKNLIFAFFLFVFLLSPSRAWAQTWSKVGTYPGGDPGFEHNVTDASLYSLNGKLYVIADDAVSEVNVFRLDSGAWTQIGTFEKSYDGVAPNARALTYYGGKLYAVTRNIYSEYLSPNEDLTNPLEWNVTGASNHWGAVHKDVIYPTAPGTTSYIDNINSSTYLERFGFEGAIYLAFSNYTSLWIYGKSTASNSLQVDSYYTDSDNVTHSIKRSVSLPTSWGWLEVKYTGTTYSNAELDSWEVELRGRDTKKYDIAAIYLGAKELSLKGYEYAGGTTWNLLGDSYTGCGSGAYFNCNATGITGFVGYSGDNRNGLGNGLYVGTGRPGTPLDEAIVYRWGLPVSNNEGVWTRIAEGGDPNPPGGLYTPPGGASATGNVDLLAFDDGNAEYLFAGGMDYNSGNFPHATMLYQAMADSNWWDMAKENDTTSFNAINARTLVNVNSNLFLLNNNSVYKYIPNNYALSRVGALNFTGHGANKGMTGCRDYLYTTLWRTQTNPNEVWRYNTATSSGWSQLGGNPAGNFGSGQGLWHGVHSAATLDDKVYVLTTYSAGTPASPWASVWEYTGAAGNCTPGTVSGLVWDDLNMDGLKAGEGAVSGATVVLTSSTDSNFSMSTVTSSSTPTNYSFTGVGAGTYIVTVTPATRYATTVPVSGQTSGLVITSASPDKTADFGEVMATTVQGYVWIDSDKSCTKNGPEVNYIVQQTDLSLVRTEPPFNTAISITAPGGSGAFSAGGVRPGTYNLSVTTASWPYPKYDKTTQTTLQWTIPTNPPATTATPMAGCL